MSQSNVLFRRRCTRQCDKMVRLPIQYLTIYNNKHLPNTIKMAKVVQNFARYERNTKQQLTLDNKSRYKSN